MTTTTSGCSSVSSSRRTFLKKNASKSSLFSETKASPSPRSPRTRIFEENTRKRVFKVVVVALVAKEKYTDWERNREASLLTNAISTKERLLLFGASLFKRRRANSSKESREEKRARFASKESRAFEFWRERDKLQKNLGFWTESPLSSGEKLRKKKLKSAYHWNTSHKRAPNASLEMGRPLEDEKNTIKYDKRSRPMKFCVIRTRRRHVVFTFIAFLCA